MNKVCYTGGTYSLRLVVTSYSTKNKNNTITLLPEIMPILHNGRNEKGKFIDMVKYSFFIIINCIKVWKSTNYDYLICALII